jgi:hypothetical protein
MDTRTCCGCGVEQPLTEFSPHHRSPGGRRSSCKTCERRKQRVRRHGDPEYVTPEDVRRARSRAAQLANRQAKPSSYLKHYGRHEHRVVAERMLGRPLKRGEIVHHIDGDKHNNAPENLRVMSQGEHVREHWGEMAAVRKERHGY